MARFVVMNRCKNNICSKEIGLCDQNLELILCSIVKHNWEGMRADFREKEELQFDLVQLLHLNSDSETRNDKSL